MKCQKIKHIAGLGLIEPKQSLQRKDMHKYIKKSSLYEIRLWSCSFVSACVCHCWRYDSLVCRVKWGLSPLSSAGWVIWRWKINKLWNKTLCPSVRWPHHQVAGGSNKANGTVWLTVRCRCVSFSETTRFAGRSWCFSPRFNSKIRADWSAVLAKPAF